MTIWMSAPGTAIDLTAARSRSEKWMPTPNISRMIPMSASSSATEVSARRPGRERPEHDPGDDVADDGRQADALGDEATGEGGHQADRDGRDQNGLVVHGSPRPSGWAQDWRGSVPERRLGQWRNDTRVGSSAGRDPTTAPMVLPGAHLAPLSVADDRF